MRRFVFLAVLLAAAGAADADQVALRNGDRLTGTIVRSDEKTLLLKTDYAGEVSLKREAIVSIDTQEPLYLMLAGGRTVVGSVVGTGGTLEVSTKNEGEVKVPLESVKAVRNAAEQKAFEEAADRKRHPHLADVWSALLDTGLSLTRGNSETLTYTMSGKAARITERSKISLYSTAIYTRDNTTPPARTTSHAIRGGLRGDFNVSERFYWFAFTDFEYDEFQHLDLRNVVGGGFGRHALKRKNATLDIFGGGSLDQEYFGGYLTANPAPPPATIPVPATTRRSGEGVFGEEFNSKLNSRMTVSERFALYPNLTRPGDYRFQFDATATTKLKSWLGWQLTFSDRYLSDPQQNVKPNDLLLSTGVRLTFGKGVF